MIFLNKEYLGPRLETLTTRGLFGTGLVVAMVKEGIAEIRYQRKKAQTGNELAVRAIQQAAAEPRKIPLPAADETLAAVVELPFPEPNPELALSA